MADKNKLQEFFQKKRQSLPIYTSSVVGGEAHNPIWIAQCKLPALPNSPIFKSAGCSSKGLAESEASSKALNYVINNNKIDITSSKGTVLYEKFISQRGKLKTPSESVKTKPSNIPKEFVSVPKSQNASKSILLNTTVLIIDLENIQNLCKEICDQRPDLLTNENFHIYVFTSPHYPYDKLIPDIFPKENLKISPSTRKDGTDTFIQVYTGAWLLDESFERYFIATRDHFGGSLVDIITGVTEKTAPWPPKEAKIIVTFGQLLEEL